MYKSIKKETLIQKTRNKTTNNTGIPTEMKEKYEACSGFSFDDVKIHYNSDKPKNIGALAYTKGNEVIISFKKTRISELS